MYRAYVTAPRLVAIVPAAGIGARATVHGQAPQPKQYRQIAGRPMLRWAVEALLAEPRIEQVVVAVAPHDAQVQSVLAGLTRTRWLPCGGPTRSDTVANALAALDVQAQDWILVHDAARPGLSPAQLTGLIDACLGDAVGGLLALPVADTLKAEQPGLDEPRAARTVARAGLWQAQTPQMFRAGLLADAYAFAARNGIEVTDEAGLIEASGHAPRLVPGGLTNLKVTWPADFEWMETWLGR